jgi:hypothetical protein
MVLRRFILVLLSILFAYGSFAQIQGELIQSRVLILFDESSSMIESWAGGKEKYKAGDELIMKLMDSVYAVNKDVEFSLRVFGHQHTVAENNCYDTKNEVAFSKDNRTQMSLRLADIRPLGVTPIAYALEQAAKYDLVDVNHNVYSIVLITDGGESCGGDICNVMNKLIKDKVYFKPYIISLEDYAPLKTAYSCMGNYLQVVKERDIPVAVGAIVEAFRPLLKITNTDYKELQTNSTNLPSVLKVKVPEIKIPDPVDTVKPVKTFAKDTVIKIKRDTIVFTKPPERPQVDKIELLQPARPRAFAINVPRVIKLGKAGELSLPPLIIDTPVAPPPPPPIVLVKEKISRAGIAKHTPFAVHTLVYTLLDAVNIPSLPPLIIDTPVTPRAVYKIARLSLARYRQFNVIFVIDGGKFTYHPVPDMPPLKLDPVPVVVKPKPKPVKAEPKKSEFKVETEEAKETTVEIYFTDGKGKFYNSTPQVQLLDPTTNQMVKKFYRTLDEQNNPDPQKDIIAGRYDLAFTEKRGVVARNVEIIANKKNKIYVKVNNASLSFAYYNAPDRPVTEFAATVIERNKEQGKVVEQKCTALLEYEPGNYHIVINTFPQDVRNVDIDFNEVELQILQPGFAKFVAEGSARSVKLYQRLGDKFLQFHVLDLNDPATQHLQIQPGEYQAHYQKGPGQASMAEKVVPFLIKSTQVTEVVIK